MAMIMVLDDGETFSAIDGCAIYIVPDDSGTDELEGALDEGAINPTLIFTADMAERVVGRFGS